MRTNKDKSLLWVVALILGICVLAASCSKSSPNRCPYEWDKCPNAMAAMREYQIELNSDYTVIYDGNRFVGILLFDSTQAFDKLMIKDNE